MSLAASVAPHLPYLRRYARALTGSQASGDAYVAAVLEAIIARPELLADTDKDVRLSLYKVLSSMWGSLAINRGPSAHAARWEASAQDRLSQIPGPQRQVFLLHAVEGFNRDQIAAIMGMTAPQVEADLQAANRQISEMLAGQIMIIEDEPLIAMDIEDIVTSLGHRCLGVARTHREAVKLAKSGARPDLILSDIQLADGSSGIEAVIEILQSFDVPVIFITAFPERLLTGNRPEPAFLITKPFSPEMVKALIAQALFFSAPAPAAA